MPSWYCRCVTVTYPDSPQPSASVFSLDASDKRQVEVFCKHQQQHTLHPLWCRLGTEKREGNVELVKFSGLLYITIHSELLETYDNSAEDETSLKKKECWRRSDCISGLDSWLIRCTEVSSRKAIAYRLMELKRSFHKYFKRTSVPNVRITKARP